MAISQRRVFDLAQAPAADPAPAASPAGQAARGPVWVLALALV
jgi:hypothetical protein